MIDDDCIGTRGLSEGGNVHWAALTDKEMGVKHTLDEALMMVAQDPDLIDQVLELAMRAREEHFPAGASTHIVRPLHLSEGLPIPTFRRKRELRLSPQHTFKQCL